jgi:hypothetical protein
MSDMDSIQLMQTTLLQGGKFIYLQEENPYSLGEVLRT